MLYIKVVQGDSVIKVEAHEDPVYVCRNKNNLIVRCSEPYAQGILSFDGSDVYQLVGKDSLNLESEYYTAHIIYQPEYEEIISGSVDEEDTTPEVPEDTTEDEIMTRAELTAAVAELNERNAMLEECLLEMSEIIYA